MKETENHRRSYLMNLAQQIQKSVLHPATKFIDGNSTPDLTFCDFISVAIHCAEDVAQHVEELKVEIDAKYEDVLEYKAKLEKEIEDLPILHYHNKTSLRPPIDFEAVIRIVTLGDRFAPIQEKLHEYRDFAQAIEDLLQGKEVSNTGKNALKKSEELIDGLIKVMEFHLDTDVLAPREDRTDKMVGLDDAIGVEAFAAAASKQEAPRDEIDEIRAAWFSQAAKELSTVIKPLLKEVRDALFPKQDQSKSFLG